MGPAVNNFSRRESDDLALHVELSSQRHELLNENHEHIKAALERLEKTLNDHVLEEEMAFHSFYKTKSELHEMLTNFEDSISKKLDDTITPVREDFAKVRTIYRVLTIIGGILMAIAVFFKDHILAHFH